MTATYDELRASIVQARDGDDSDAFAQGRGFGGFSWLLRELRDLMPRGSSSESGGQEALFALPLTRILSGWGGILGLGLGLVLAISSGGWWLLLLPLLGALAGSLTAIAALVALASMVDQFGARTASALAGLSLVWLLWLATTPLPWSQ